MRLNKILKRLNILLIVVIVMVSISAVLFVLSPKYKKKIEDFELKDYGNLIGEGLDVEGEYVKVTISEKPINFGWESYDNVKSNYYFLWDPEDHLYAARLSDSKVKEIENAFDENGEDYSYELKGFIYKINDDMKKIAIDYFNEGFEEEFLNQNNYSIYLGQTYIDDSKTPDDLGEALLFIGIGIDIFAAIFFLVYLVERIKFSKAIKKYGKENIELELERVDTIAYDKQQVYLTTNYVISSESGLSLIPYGDIVWVYKENRRVNGVSSGLCVVCCTKNKKAHVIAYSFKNEGILTDIINKIHEKAPSAMIGYTLENEKAYKALRKS